MSFITRNHKFSPLPLALNLHTHYVLCMLICVSLCETWKLKIATLSYTATQVKWKQQHVNCNETNRGTINHSCVLQLNENFIIYTFFPSCRTFLTAFTFLANEKNNKGEPRKWVSEWVRKGSKKYNWMFVVVQWEFVWLVEKENIYKFKSFHPENTAMQIIFFFSLTRLTSFHRDWRSVIPSCCLFFECLNALYIK